MPNNDTRSFVSPQVSSDLSRARARELVLARVRVHICVLRIYDAQAYAHSNPPIDIDGSHNAETNRVPR